MQLNRITDAGAGNLRRIYDNWLKDGVGGWRKYEAHLNVGLLAWREGDADTMRDHLSAAANQAIDVIDHRDPDKTDAVREPSDLDLPLMLTLIFGDNELKKRLARLPRRSWFQPETAEYKPLAELFDWLRSFPRHDTPDATAIGAILALNRQPQAHCFYKPRIDAMGAGLLAIAAGDRRGVDQALNDLLERHQDEAFEGDWQYLVEGLIAGWASVLWLLARNAGMRIDTDSPYVTKAAL